MVVGVGSLSDPANMQGLSHYLEHMLFMGSEKFPDENDYDSFLSKNGGGSNAYTELVRRSILTKQNRRAAIWPKHRDAHCHSPDPEHGSHAQRRALACIYRPDLPLSI